MTLSGILDGVTVTKLIHRGSRQGSEAADLPVTGIRYDSREVMPGDLYAALPGLRTDGRRFVPDAVKEGAVAVVLEDDGAYPDEFFLHAGVAKIVVPAARKALAEISCNFFGHPSGKLTLIGVTGTNGKTTTTHLVRSVLEHSGRKTGLVGTMSYHDGRSETAATHTTPESPDMNRLLAEMLNNGCSAAVMEVSSHSLAMSRVHGLTFAAAAFTNLTQDHLDFHGSMEEYFRSKKILFDTLRPGSLAVTNSDDPYGKRIIGGIGAKTMTYGRTAGADVLGRSVTTGTGGTELTVEYNGESHRVSSSLIGEFNASNILATYAVCAGIGVPQSVIVRGIAGVKSVRGRFEPIRSEAGWTAVIDYAHTPDALENTLRAVRALSAGGRVLTIFGCGGDRDRGKRPLMGAVASSLSDVTIVTSDNPRSEDPGAIIREILGGIPKGSTLHVEPDRRRAIRLGLGMARKGDIVLIAGKGHETYQIIGESRIPFDDREEVLRFPDRP